METYQLKQDITVLYMQAASFPMGVEKAFKELESKVADHTDRLLFGISRPDESGQIIYKAALKEAFDGEGAKLGCETIVIKKGPYLCETLTDWKDNKMQIGPTFMKLLADPRMDNSTYCYEWYNGDEMMCMILLKPGSVPEEINELPF